MNHSLAWMSQVCSTIRPVMIMTVPQVAMAVVPKTSMNAQNLSFSKISSRSSLFDAKRCEVAMLYIYIVARRLCVTTSAEPIVRNAVADGCLPTAVFSDRPFV